MDAERARAFLLQLPHVVETSQWGNNLVFWAGDKAIGGKMFIVLDLDAAGHVLSFPAGPDCYHELLETEGLFPAPYLARIHWIAAERWDVFPRDAEWQGHLRHAYDLTLAKLPPRTHAVLALPTRERQRLIADRRKLLAARAAAKPTTRHRK